jgi:pyrroline-5-carboxylate reductase
MNVQVAMRSDLIFLATAPDKVNTILAELRAANALSGKVLVSLIAGVTIAQMEEALFSWNGSQLPVQLSSPCCILRARPTMASWLAKSITAISHPSDRSQSKEALDLVDSFFLSVGSIYHFPEPLIDSAAVLYGEAPAFFALFCDAIVDGAVVGGLNRGQAERMTVKALEGTSDMLSILEKPSSMREKLCASPGNTSECIMALERGGVRGKISTAMWDCMLAALSPN